VKKNKREVIPLNEKLTPKQERFIQNIVSGMSQREAYKNSYNAENMGDKTIDEAASRLFNDSKINARYKELMEKLEDEAIMTAKQRMKWLSDVVNNIQKEDIYLTADKGAEGMEDVKIGSKNDDLNPKMKAIDILNKMSGEYKTILDGSVGITKKLEDLL